MFNKRSHFLVFRAIKESCLYKDLLKNYKKMLRNVEDTKIKTENFLMDFTNFAVFTFKRLSYRQHLFIARNSGNCGRFNSHCWIPISGTLCDTLAFNSPTAIFVLVLGLPSPCFPFFLFVEFTFFSGSFIYLEIVTAQGRRGPLFKYGRLQHAPSVETLLFTACALFPYYTQGIPVPPPSLVVFCSKIRTSCRFF